MAISGVDQQSLTVEKDVLLSGQRESVKSSNLDLSSSSQPRSTSGSLDKQVTVTESECSRSMTPVPYSGLNSPPPSPQRDQNHTPNPSSRLTERQKRCVALPLSPPESVPNSKIVQRPEPIPEQIYTPPPTTDKSTRSNLRADQASVPREDESSGHPGSSLEPVAHHSPQSPCPTARRTTPFRRRAPNRRMQASSSQDQGSERASTANSRPSQLPESPVDSGVLVKSESSGASETSLAIVPSTGSSSSVSQLSSLPSAEKYIELVKAGILTVDEARHLLQPLLGLNVKAEQYTAEVVKSWIPNDVSPPTLNKLMNILLQPLSPGDPSDAYIYIYCEAKSMGYIDPSTGKPLSFPKEYSHVLPYFWRADGKLLDLEEALLDRSDPATLQTPDEEQKPYHIRIKIGYSRKDVKTRLKSWRSKCRKDIMLLMLYDFEDGFGKLTNPIPMRHPSHRSSSFDNPRGEDDSPARYANPDPLDVPWRDVYKTRGVPYGKRVESLIHYHLEEERRDRQCTCGTRHKELFEFPATVENIQKVDKSIRRWISWAKNREAHAIDEQGEHQMVMNYR